MQSFSSTAAALEQPAQPQCLVMASWPCHHGVEGSQLHRPHPGSAPSTWAVHPILNKVQGHTRWRCCLNTESFPVPVFHTCSGSPDLSQGSGYLARQSLGPPRKVGPNNGQGSLVGDFRVGLQLLSESQNDSSTTTIVPQVIKQINKEECDAVG